jgi:hypothetical protein
VAHDAPAYAQLLDLAQLDGRFSPVLIAASVQRVVEAWEESSTGSQQPLALVASQSAATALLHPDASDGEARLVVRDATVERCEPIELELSSTPPMVRLGVDVSAVRYLWDGAAPIGGNIEARHPMSMSWTLELRDNREPPWQLLRTTNPLPQSHTSEGSGRNASAGGPQSYQRPYSQNRPASGCGLTVGTLLPGR